MNKFGLTEQQHTQETMTSAERTAEWLMVSYEAEKDLVLTNGIKGLHLSRYRAIAEKIRGIQPGMFGILAKSNIGKTTLLTSLCNDVFLAGAENGQIVKCCFYTFDDSKDDMRIMLIADLAEVYKNRIDNKRQYAQEEEKVATAYRQLAEFARAGLFTMKDSADITTIEEFVDDVKREKEELLAKFPDAKMAVFIDGQGNLGSSAPGGIRELNVFKANEIRKLATLEELPILLTLETPALKDRWRPIKEDVSESVKYAFNCKVIVALSPIDARTETEQGDPVINVEFVKNKCSGFKGSIFAYRKGYFANFRMATEEENQGLKHRAADFDREYFGRKK